jgi:hypothetical protein
VIAIVQYIRTIFEQAEKTIAIKEAGGIQECCAEAVRGFQTIHDIHNRFMQHAYSEHWSRRWINEDYLNRLWTLQEILLSHTVQFTACSSGTSFLFRF